MELLIEHSPLLIFQSNLKTPQQPLVRGSADLLKPSIMRAGLGQDARHSLILTNAMNESNRMR
jgi:hypothetical protein